MKADERPAPEHVHVTLPGHQPVLYIPEEISIQEFKQLLLEAVTYVREEGFGRLQISGFHPFLKGQKKRKVKAELITLLANHAVAPVSSDRFPVQLEEMQAYAKVADLLDAGEPSAVKSPYFFYEAGKMPDAEKKNRARYGRMQKAAFDPNNIRARKEVVKDRAKSFKLDDILRRFKENNLKTSRNKEHSATSIRRLYDDYYKIYANFDSNRLASPIEVPVEAPAKMSCGPNLVAYTEDTKRKDLNLNFENGMLDDDGILKVERTLSLLFNGTLQKPLYLNFQHDGKLIDTLQVLPEMVTDNQLDIDILEHTVLFPGKYEVSVYNLNYEDLVDEEPKAEIQSRFTAIVGKGVISLPRDFRTWLNEETDKYYTSYFPSEP